MSKWKKSYKMTPENIVPVHTESVLRGWIARAEQDKRYCSPEQLERYKIELDAIQQRKAQGLPVPQEQPRPKPAAPVTKKAAKAYKEVMPPGYLDN